MGKIVGAIVLGLIAFACFVGSHFQFKEKGFLFNNAYLYAPKEERERMNKTPHYKQSGTVFVMVGIIFLLNAVDMLLKTEWIFYIVIAVALCAIIYAIVSSILIERKKG